MGSRDRKIASRLVYNYYRLGKAMDSSTVQDKLSVAEFLCNDSSNSFLSYFRPEWESKLGLPIEDKLKEVRASFPQFNLEEVFPFLTHLSKDINSDEFLKSLFVQPDLYVRVKRGGEKRFQQVLIKEEIKFKHLGGQAFSFANGTKLESLPVEKGTFEIQDLTSQQTGDLFVPQKWDRWWDCCAASGGKSLLLHDIQPDIKLLVSDIRESILDNLDERFRNAGLKGYQKKVLDLSHSPRIQLHDYEFDGIIVDAPCSGSGTWGRTPEMISQFNAPTIHFFQELQRKIVSNVDAYLKPGKPLIYITCSVFKEENEEQLAWMADTFELRVEEQHILKGYEQKADTMFVARLVKK